ncbi:MAG: winged helix-turn-helix domain-containing protein [Silvania sp.]|uniref:winged helix-turn-helix domain-containing protein n=1 Tax=Silvania sp. TaxID=3016633 RepID=UPI003EE71BD9
MNTLRYSVNNWLLDLSAGTIVHLQTGEVKRLGEYQIKLLYCLAQHAGQTLTRNELTALVWERRVIGDNSLSNAIHALRSALEDDGKLQRVIKTIPKRGYLLEAEYCQSVEVPAQEGIKERVEAPDITPVDLPPLPEPAPVMPTNIPAVKLAGSLKKIPRAIILAVLVGLLLITISGWYSSYIHNADMVYREQGKGRFSNIRTYKISLSSDNAGDDDLTRFNTIFQKINQTLINQDAGMTVFYRTTEQMLNYTFAIETPCASQQLAMTLYHWRIDRDKLVNIINRETERVLNEMADCKKPKN